MAPQPLRDRCEKNKQSSEDQEPAAVRACPQLRTDAVRTRIKIAMRAVVARHRLPQIVWTMSIFRSVVLLRIVTFARQIMIEQAGKKFVADNRLDCRHTDINFASRMVRRIDDRLGCNFGLKNWRHWLCLTWQPAFDPPELRRVERGHLD